MTGTKWTQVGQQSSQSVKYHTTGSEQYTRLIQTLRFFSLRNSVVYTQSNAKAPFLNGTALSQTGISTPGVTYIIIPPSLAPFEAAAVLRPANNHESRAEERCFCSLPDASSSSASTTMAGNKRDSDSQRGFGATRFDQCCSLSFCQYAKCSSAIWYSSQRVLEKYHFANG